MTVYVTHYKVGRDGGLILSTGSSEVLSTSTGSSTAGTPVNTRRYAVITSTGATTGIKIGENPVATNDGGSQVVLDGQRIDGWLEPGQAVAARDFA